MTLETVKGPRLHKVLQLQADVLPTGHESRPFLGLSPVCGWICFLYSDRIGPRWRLDVSVIVYLGSFLYVA